jgi:hypothetical protein
MTLLPAARDKNTLGIGLFGYTVYFKQGTLSRLARKVSGYVWLFVVIWLSLFGLGIRYFVGTVSILTTLRFPERIGKRPVIYF